MIKVYDKNNKLVGTLSDEGEWTDAKHTHNTKKKKKKASKKGK